MEVDIVNFISLKHFERNCVRNLVESSFKCKKWEENIQCQLSKRTVRRCCIGILLIFDGVLHVYSAFLKWWCSMHSVLHVNILEKVIKSVVQTYLWYLDMLCTTSMFICYSYYTYYWHAIPVNMHGTLTICSTRDQCHKKSQLDVAFVEKCLNLVEKWTHKLNKWYSIAGTGNGRRKNALKYSTVCVSVSVC